MIEYFLESETPSKKNSKVFNTKTHRMFPSAKYRAWHEYAALVVLPKVKECIKEKCYVILVFQHGDNIRRDADNSVSSIFDMLQDFKAIEDDRWQLIPHHHVFNTYEKGKPWCRVMIYKPEEKEDYKAALIKCIEQYE